MKWPPETEEEIQAYLRYQKDEGLLLDITPKRVKVNGKLIVLPEEVREQIAQLDDFVNGMRGLLERFLISEHQSDYLAASGNFELISC